MRLYEITFSPTGGTEKAADMLLKAFPEAYEKISLLECQSLWGIFIPKRRRLCDSGSFLWRTCAGDGVRTSGADERKRGGVYPAVCLRNRAFEDTLTELKQVAEEAGFVPRAAAAVIAEHSIMRQFASGRPDASDEKELLNLGQKSEKGS